MSNRELGNEGERIACEYLVKNGYKILGKNYRITFGEIDIIVQKKQKFFGRRDKTIHFVEVKALKNVFQSFFPEQRVDVKKQKKLKQLAEIWMAKNKVPENTPYQIDIIAVQGESADFFEDVVSG